MTFVLCSILKFCKYKFQLIRPSAAAMTVTGLFLFNLPLSAEQIILKDGRILYGKISGQSINEIQVRTEKGTEALLKKDIKIIKWVQEDPKLKRKKAEENRRKIEAVQKEKERIQKEKLESEEKDRLLKEIEAKEREEKQALAKERAQRAEALRELVKNDVMDKPNDEPISYWDFAWRSLLVPGWGHLKIERPVMGSLYMISTAALLGNLYSRGMAARSAVRVNQNQVQMNYFFIIAPQAAPVELRLAYSQYSNAQAVSTYQKKIDYYNNSLYLLEVFYGLQILHIIYNGFAWEKGLLIVDGGKINTPVKNSVRTDLIIAPEFSETGKITGLIRAGVSYYF